MARIKRAVNAVKKRRRSLNFQRATMVLRASSTVQLPSR